METLPSHSTAGSDALRRGVRRDVSKLRMTRSSPRMFGLITRRSRVRIPPPTRSRAESFMCRDFVLGSQLGTAIRHPRHATAPELKARWYGCVVMEPSACRARPRTRADALRNRFSCRSSPVLPIDRGGGGPPGRARSHAAIAIIQGHGRRVTAPALALNSCGGVSPRRKGHQPSTAAGSDHASDAVKREGQLALVREWTGRVPTTRSITLGRSPRAMSPSPPDLSSPPSDSCDERLSA